MTPHAAVASAGKGDAGVRSDCLVEVEIKTRGGIGLTLQSKVEKLYGESIAALLKEVCASLGVHHAAFHIVDQGALPFVLAARIESAVRRASPGLQTSFLPAPLVRRQAASLRDRMRRTRLYLPGNEPKYLINAGLHGPDCIVLDLEDSVPPDEKDAARLLVRNALRSVDFLGSERMVRINQGRMGLEDLRAIMPSSPGVILLPKCEDAEQVQSIETEMRSLERRHKIGYEVLLLPIIESALGIVHAYAIASASPRVCALAIGLEDFTADIGVERTPEGRESLFARATVVTAAKAAGVQALDSVYSDVEDAEGLRNSTRESKSLGFDGRGCVHPRQVADIHSALAPRPAEVQRAQQILLAFERARKSGSGVAALGSTMIDLPVVARAERVLRLAQQLGLIESEWRSSVVQTDQGLSAGTENGGGVE